MKPLLLIVLPMIAAATAVTAQENTKEPRMMSDPAMLTLDRIFAEHEFKDRSLGEWRWSKRTASYFTLEAPHAGGKGQDLCATMPPRENRRSSCLLPSLCRKDKLSR